MKEKLIYKYINFRCKQTLRLLNYNLDYSFIFIVVSLIIYFTRLPAYLYLLIYFLCFSFLNKRKDIVFIKKLFGNKFYFIQVFENLIVFFYISLLLISKIHNYKIFVLGIFLAFLSPKATLNAGKINLKFVDSLPFHIFEWKSALRKNIFTYALLYILLIASTYHPFTFIIMLLFISSILIETYKYFEPKELYISYFEKFSLVEKYKISVKLFNVFLIPPFILFGLMNYMHSEFLLLFFIINLFFLEVISRKYKHYSENQCEIESNPIIILILLIKSLLIIPSIYSIYSNTQIANQKIQLYVRN